MNKVKTLALTAALTIFAIPAVAQDRETPPPGGTPKDFSLPDAVTFTLDNGLNVTMVEFGSVPKATVAVVVRSGNLNEGENTWLADLSGDFLMEGTTTRSSEDIAREAAAMGGSVFVSVGEDQTNIGGQALSDFVPDLIGLLADMALNPSFPESELERLRRDRIRQVSVAQTQPQQMASSAFRAAIYGDHPYGRSFPTEEQLSGYTIDDARGFYEDNFGAQRTHVYIAGMFDPDAARAAIEDAFADWHAGPEVLINPPVPAEGKVSVGVIDRPDAVQSNIYLGLPVANPGDDDWIALSVANTLLGGSFSSRITRNIREDKGYTYSPFSQISVRYRDGFWAQVAAVTTDVTGPALQEIMNEIDRLSTEPPSEEELDGIKNYAAGIFVLQNSTRNGIIGVLSYQNLHDMPDDYLTNYVSDVYALTPEDISTTVSTYLREEDMTLIVVGDRGQISEQVDDWIGDPEPEAE